jgi:hypothetical protein
MLSNRHINIHLALAYFYYKHYKDTFNDHHQQMTQQINLSFHQQLNDFLPVEQRETQINYVLNAPRSVKDLIESIGVPHVEIDLIIVNGESVDFNYLVKEGDDISVYPVLDSAQISQHKTLSTLPLKHCHPKPWHKSKFVLDVHLGKLACYLRMLGFDTLYRNDYDDPTLARISVAEHRILLTCDLQLLFRKHLTHGYFVRSRQPQQQLREIIVHYDLFKQPKPFSRCMRCNGKIHPVAKQGIAARLSDATKKYYDDFYICEDCENIYWKGSHYQKMQKMIELLERKNE